MTATPDQDGDQDLLDRIIAVLVRHGVDFIAIGGWAVRAQRYELGRVTYDVDVAPEGSHENRQRLSMALDELDAKVRFGDESLPFSHDADSLSRSAMWNLRCQHGDFDIFFEPTGIDGGYDELAQGARLVALTVDEETIVVRCADLVDIVRSKEATGRFKDREDLAVLMPQLGEHEIDEHGHDDGLTL